MFRDATNHANGAAPSAVWRAALDQSTRQLIDVDDPYGDEGELDGGCGETVHQESFEVRGGAKMGEERGSLGLL